MQIHPPAALVGSGEFPVHRSPGNWFAVIDVDPDGSHTRIFLETISDCDRLDRAIAKARVLLAGVQPAGTDAS